MEYVRYPLRYEEHLMDSAEAFGLDPWHVAAVVKCESGFYPKSVSSAGALGLMQIMPETGKWLAGKFYEESKFYDEILFEPEVNLKYGCWYLSWLMERFNGDIVLATAAFHAGQGQVDAWLRNSEISPDGVTIPVENIPYKETRKYIGNVLRACEKYQELYDFEGLRDEA